DKEPLFDSVDTLAAILAVLPPLLASLTFRADRMRRAAGEHFSTATDLADYLVRKGLPFREAHAIVGRIVRHALDEGKTLEDLTLARVYRVEDDGSREPPSALLANGGIAGWSEVATIRLAAPEPATLRGNRVVFSDDRGLALGRRYTYVVVAVDSLGRAGPP